jgi:hypothetical protein
VVPYGLVNRAHNFGGIVSLYSKHRTGAFYLEGGRQLVSLKYWCPYTKLNSISSHMSENLILL